MKVNIRDSYVITQGWMRTDLKLKGNKLDAYALIYGFSQDGKSEFTGSLAYIQEWLGCTKKTAINTIKKLEEDNLIFKRKETVNGVTYSRYSADLKELKRRMNEAKKDGVKFTPSSKKGGVKNTPMGVKNLHSGGVKITPNNIEYNIDNINTLSPAHEKVSKTDPLPTQTEPQENDGGKYADLPDEERKIMEAYDKVKSILDRYPATKDLWLNSAGLKWTHEQFDNELLAWIRHNASDHFLLNITRKYTKFPNWLKKAKQFAPSPKNSRVRQMNKKNDSKVIPEPSEEYMEKLRGMTMKEKLALAG